MRLDQFLQKTGVVKTRTAAKELCDRGAVELNRRAAKPAHEVKVADALAVRFHDRRCYYEILDIPRGNVKKEARMKFVRLVSEERFHRG